jgi:hypothetical protein
LILIHTEKQLKTHHTPHLMRHTTHQSYISFTHTYTYTYTHTHIHIYTYTLSITADYPPHCVCCATTTNAHIYVLAVAKRRGGRTCDADGMRERVCSVRQHICADIRQAGGACLRVPTAFHTQTGEGFHACATTYREGGGGTWEWPSAQVGRGWRGAPRRGVCRSGRGTGACTRAHEHMWVGGCT